MSPRAGEKARPMRTSRRPRHILVGCVGAVGVVVGSSRGCPAERSCAQSGSYPTDTSSGLLSLSLISSWLTRMNTNVMIEPTQIMAAPTMNA
jgi:hypothetical protein